MLSGGRGVYCSASKKGAKEDPGTTQSSFVDLDDNNAATKQRAKEEEFEAQSRRGASGAGRYAAEEQTQGDDYDGPPAGVQRMQLSKPAAGGRRGRARVSPRTKFRNQMAEMRESTVGNEDVGCDDVGNDDATEGMFNRGGGGGGAGARRARPGQVSGQPGTDGGPGAAKMRSDKTMPGNRLGLAVL